MSNPGKLFLVIGTCCGLLACGSSGDGTPGSGGSGATGAAGSGNAGTGGGSAGSTGGSGQAGSGGTSGVAGATGAGGSAAGASGAAGAKGGSGGSAGGAVGSGGSAGGAGGTTAGQGGSGGRGGATAGTGGGQGGSAGATGQGGSGGRGGATAGTGGSGGTTAGSGGATGAGGSGGGGTQSWVGTWATGPQLTETANNPPSPLSNTTLRQVIFTSISGSQVRLRLSNEFGNGSVTMNAVHIALSTSGSSIDTSTDKAVTFNGGSASVTIAQSQAVFSDPFAFTVPSLTKVAITIAFGTAPSNVTGHPGSRTTSYEVSGSMVSAATLTGAQSAEHWYYIVGLDVMAPAGTSAAVTLGDSITDGRGSTTDMNNRWPDDFSRRLQANAPTMNKVAVLNQGIGGNAVLTGGLGPTAQARFMRDVLQMRGAKWLIILEGVNDLGGSSNGMSTATQLETAFSSFADMAHAAGMKVYGATIMPLGTSYYNADRETGRTAFNTWMKGSAKFDAVFDFDAAVRDPQSPSKMLSTYDSGDGLHPNVAGHQKLADTVDLTKFQ